MTQTHRDRPPLNTTVPRRLREAVVQEAQERGVKLSRVVEEALRDRFGLDDDESEDAPR